MAELNLNLPNNNHVEHICMVFAILISSLKMYLFKSLIHFKIFIYDSVLRALYLIVKMSVYIDVF